VGEGEDESDASTSPICRNVKATSTHMLPHLAFASALCFSRMDAFFIVTTTTSIMAFAYYLIAHSSSFLWSFGLPLLHDNVEDVSSLDNYIFSYLNSFKIDSLSLSTSITSKDLGLFKGISFRLSFLVFAHQRIPLNNNE